MGKDDIVELPEIPDGEDIDKIIGDGKEVKEGKEKKPPKVPMHKLFHFANGLDIFMIIIAAIMAMAHGLIQPAFALIFGELADAFNKPPKELYDATTRLALYFLIAGGAGFVTSYFQTAFLTHSAERQIKRLRQAYLHSILRQDVGWFDLNGSGSLTTRIAGDTVVIQEAIGEKLGTGFQFLAQFIGGFALGFFKGWKLTLVLLSVTPLLGIAGAAVMKVMQSQTASGQKSYADAGAVASEVFSSMRTVASFGGEEKEIARYSKNLVNARKQGIKKSLYAGLGLGVTFAILFFSYALALWYGSRLVVNGEQSGGEVLTTFFAVIFAAFATGQMSPSFEALAKGQGAAYVMFDTINRTPPIDINSPEGKKLDSITGDLEFKNVSFRYPTRTQIPIFSGINLKIKAGQTVALVGPSGCGKSSAIALLERFYDPLNGEVTLDGTNIKDFNLRWYRQQFGLVGQEPVLFAGTIAENIGYGKKGCSMEEIEQAARSSNAHNFIMSFPDGYNTFVGEKGAQLSGGQKQRIAIARAIVRDPKILLLDEATSALDSESERVVQDALDTVMKGRTTVVIAHRLSTIRHADVIVCIKGGVVAELGNHKSLMELDGIYAELVKIQGAESHEMEKAKVEKVASKEDDGNHITIKVAAEEDKKKKPKEKLYKVSLMRLFKYNLPETPYLILGFLTSAAAGVVFPVYAVVFSGVLDVYYQPPSKIEKDIVIWVVGFIIIGIAAFLTNAGLKLFLGIAGEKLTERIRTLTFQAIIRHNIGWFDSPKHSSGILTSRLASDAALIEGILGTNLGLVIQNIASLIAGLVIAFYTGWKLTLVVLACSPAIAFGSSIRMISMKGFAEQTQQAEAEANQIASEAIGNIRTVASFTTERKIESMFANKLEPPYKVSIKRAHTSGVLSGLGDLVLFASYTLIFWYGGKLIYMGEYTFIQVIRVFSAILMSAMGIGQSAALAPNAAKAKAACSEIFKLVDDKLVIDSSSKEGSVVPITGNIKLKNLKFSYPERPDTMVLKGLSLKIKAGKVVALVGPSGCGKSSIVGLIERFYDPQEGEVIIDGTNLKDFNLKKIRSQIGLVGQEPVLFVGSIKENIAYGNPDATEEDIIEACKAANAHKFISNFPNKYDTQVGEKGAQLSGGQKQRIAIARAIVKNPKILLLDEATSALDTESEKVVQDALDTVMKGRTTLVIAHRLSTIRNADVIAVIKDGVVVEKGNHDKLMKLKGIYYDLVMKPQQQKQS